MWTWIEHKHKLRWMCVAQSREQEREDEWEHEKKQSTPYESDWKCFQTMQNELAENEKKNGRPMEWWLCSDWGEDEHSLYMISRRTENSQQVSLSPLPNCWRRRTRTFSHQNHLERSWVKLYVNDLLDKVEGRIELNSFIEKSDAIFLNVFDLHISLWNLIENEDWVSGSGCARSEQSSILMMHRHAHTDTNNSSSMTMSRSRLPLPTDVIVACTHKHTMNCM